MKDRIDALWDAFIAEGLVNRVFRMEVGLAIARQQSDPVKWTETFISTLHERLDSSEGELSSSDARHHEAARQKIDELGAFVLQQLSAPPS